MNIIYTESDVRYIPICRVIDNDLSGVCWQPSKLPFYDMLDIQKPDLLFIDYKHITNLISKELNSLKIPVVIFGNGLPHNINAQCLVASSDMHPKLRKNIESDKYYTYFCKNSANIIDLFWYNTWYSYNNEFNNIQLSYYNNNHDNNTYNDKILILSKLSHNYNVKIFGPYKISLSYYMGQLSSTELAAMYHNSEFVLDYNNDQFLDILANGGYPITRLPTKLSISYFNSIEKFTEIIRNGRDKYTEISNLQQEILNSETGYHRAIDIFNLLGNKDIVNNLQTKLQERLQCVQEY